MPVQKRPIFTTTIIAAAAFTEGLGVGFDGALPAAGAAVKGFADHDAAIGDELAIDQLGTTIGVAGAAIAEGAELEITAAGKLITKAAGIAVARAEQAAAADGDQLEIFPLPH